MFLLNNIKRLFFNFVKQSFLLRIFLFSYLLLGQNFNRVDATVCTYSSKINNTNELAKKIDNDFSNDLDKVRALYIYLTHNIEYDLNEYKYGADNYSFRYSSKEELEKQIRQRDLKIIHKTLYRKKAICEGYSMAFKEVCGILDINCVVISGYTRTISSEIGKLPLEGRHAWNAVYINSKWRFIDTTWGAGYSRDSEHWIKSYDEHYFFTPPKELITTHFPEEKKWQLVASSKTETQFTNQPLYSSLFFNEGIELVSPKDGIIDSHKEFLILKLKNVKPDVEFGYAFEKDYYLTSIIPEYKKNNATLRIPLKGKNNTTLNILSGTEMVLQFQIP
jgi:transglutaminase/protease-like cytokinesis protein 3